MALDATDLELIARILITPLVDEFRIEMRAATTEMRTMRTEMVAGFDGLNTRVDQLILNTGEHWRDHERRLLRLERLRNGNGSGSDEDESGEE